jgi:hypothetical protein
MAALDGDAIIRSRTRLPGAMDAIINAGTDAVRDLH